MPPFFKHASAVAARHTANAPQGKISLSAGKTNLPAREQIVPSPVPVLETPLATLLSWQTHERHNETPTQNIKIALGTVTAALLGYSLYTQNFLFSIVIVLASFVWYAYAHRPPHQIDFAITTRGIQIQNRLYEFGDLKSFWIFFDPPHVKELSIESKKTFMPFLKIPLGDMKPTIVREQLIKFIPEQKQEETLTDIVSRRFGL